MQILLWVKSTNQNVFYPKNTIWRPTRISTDTKSRRQKREGELRMPLLGMNPLSPESSETHFAFVTKLFSLLKSRWHLLSARHCAGTFNMKGVCIPPKEEDASIIVRGLETQKELQWGFQLLRVSIGAVQQVSAASWTRLEIAKAKR